MSFSLVALNLKGMEGLLLGLSRCYGRGVRSEEYLDRIEVEAATRGNDMLDTLVGEKAYDLKGFAPGGGCSGELSTFLPRRYSSCGFKGSRGPRQESGGHGGA